MNKYGIRNIRNKRNACPLHLKSKNLDKFKRFPESATRGVL